MKATPTLILLLSGLLLCSSVLCSYAQNMVLNPSFEEIQTSRSGDDELKLLNPVSSASYWDSPNQGEPRLYSSTSEGYVHDEYGSRWKFKARSGKNVAGLYVHGGGNTDLSMDRGYIQGSLAKPLEVGKKYYFSFWVHYHCEGSSKIGIAFLPEKTHFNKPGRIRMRPASYQAKVARYDQTDWTVVQDSFIAYKPFKTFIIGNFFNNEETDLESNNYGHHFAYIDDVSVEEAPNQAENTPEVELDKLEMMKWEMNVMTAQNTVTARIDTSPVLEDLSSPQLEAFFAKQIFFDLGSSLIRPDEKEYLGILLNQMLEKTDFKIKIIGFASDEGTNVSNLSLSSARAESVMSYFRSQGVNPARLYVQGLGEVEGDGDESLGKAYNRRVDFEIIYK